MKANPIFQESDSSHLLLNVDRILLKRKWKSNLDLDGGKVMPRPPLIYGFRGGSKFWFGDVKRAYAVPLPATGLSMDIVLLEAKRFQREGIEFTREACEQLTGVPRMFLGSALREIADEAKQQGIQIADAEFVRAIQQRREMRIPRATASSR
jgi:hypothetical protein